MNNTIVLRLIIILISGIFLNACSNDSENSGQAEGSRKPADNKRKILFYRHPMDPKITSKTPKKGSMGMPYKAVYAEGSSCDDANGDDVVKISANIVNSMGVRTAQVVRGDLSRQIDTVAFVQFDEDKMLQVHMRAKGWIKNLKVRSAGERVTKGQILFEYYSPDLVNAQEEFLQALRSNNSSLIRASRSKLLALDISTQQISKIIKQRKVNQLVQVYAQQSGIVSKLNVREGMYVRPHTRVMTLADLSTVWLQVQVFESQSNWVKVGQTAKVRIRYLPGVILTGKVDYIYPMLDVKTRTLQVRLRFNNPQEKLKPNMYAMVAIDAKAEENIIIIPREALIRTGKEQRVVISLGKGRFTSRKVRAGIESGEQVQIIKGLKEGERVVTSGQFLIDSEASIKASITRMSDAKDDPSNKSISKTASPNMKKSMSDKSLPANTINKKTVNN